MMHGLPGLTAPAPLRPIDIGAVMNSAPSGETLGPGQEEPAAGAPSNKLPVKQDQKGSEMTTDETAAPGDGEAGALPFDTSMAHRARIAAATR